MGNYYWTQVDIKASETNSLKYGSNNVTSVVYAGKPVYVLKYGNNTVYEWWHHVVWYARLNQNSWNNVYPGHYSGGSSLQPLYFHCINYSKYLLYMRWIHTDTANKDVSISTAWSGATNGQSAHWYLVYPESVNGYHNAYGGYNRNNYDSNNVRSYSGSTSWWRSSSVVLWPIGPYNDISGWDDPYDDDQYMSWTSNDDTEYVCAWARCYDYFQSLNNTYGVSITPPGKVVLDFRYQYEDEVSDE